jgi:tRNA wybutosine-synthesizing protein 3
MSDPNFDARKARILAEIESSAPDLSPKGFIDVQILPLISRLNVHEDMVTTSSCSGRISVFVEGAKDTSTRVGGKGDGGRWLFVDHDSVDIAGMSDSQIAEKMVGERAVAAAEGGAVEVGAMTRFVHFKFETMVSSPSDHSYLRF